MEPSAERPDQPVKMCYIYCHYMKWYVNDVYKFLNLYLTHILIEVVIFFLFSLILNNIYLYLIQEQCVYFEDFFFLQT